MPSPSPSPTSLRGRPGRIPDIDEQDVDLTRELMRQTLQQAHQARQARRNIDADEDLSQEDVDEVHETEQEIAEEEVLAEIQTAEGEGTVDEVDIDAEPPFDATGLKDIGNLASWTVTTFKPGCGVAELRSEDTNLFWQSDGPQPHHLNIHFTRFVSIRAIRLYLDFEADESYTPTRITMLGGTGYHDLIPFANLEFNQPKGWIDVDLKGVGGGPDGNTLRAFLIQVKIIENHQNGKDTHLRGLKIYAADDKAGQAKMDSMFDEFFSTTEETGKGKKKGGDSKGGQRKVKKSMFTEPDWMTEPEIR